MIGRIHIWVEPTLLAFMIVLLSVASTHPSRADGIKTADTALLDGKIITLDEEESVVEAIAIRDGRILAVGTNDEIKKHISHKTNVFRLAGQTVIPGIIEAVMNGIASMHDY